MPGCFLVTACNQPKKRGNYLSGSCLPCRRRGWQRKDVPRALQGGAAVSQHLCEGWKSLLWAKENHQKIFHVSPGWEKPGCHTRARLSPCPELKGTLQARGWLHIPSHISWEKPFLVFFTIFPSQLWDEQRQELILAQTKLKICHVPQGEVKFASLFVISSQFWQGTKGFSSRISVLRGFFTSSKCQPSSWPQFRAIATEEEKLIVLCAFSHLEFPGILFLQSTSCTSLQRTKLGVCEFWSSCSSHVQKLIPRGHAPRFF